MIGVDFAVLPPEVVSGRVYAGPGSGSLVVAGREWGRLAGELAVAARGVSSVVSGLTGQGWLGAASEACAAVVGSFGEWLGVTAGVAERAAGQALAAASAFDEVLAAVVPPVVVAANRGRLAVLVAGNVLGVNAAAIAAVEAEYGLMWVQDAVAMSGYAARSAAVVAGLGSFSPPPSSGTDPTGAHPQLTQLLTAIPQTLHALAAAGPGQGTPALTPTQIASYLTLIPRSIVPFNDAIKTILYGMVQFSRNLSTDLDIAAATGGKAGFGAAVSAIEPVVAAAPAPGVSAGLGNAATVGRLTVPPNWVATAPAIKLAAAATLPPAAAGAAPLPTGVFADLALAGLLGRSIAGSAPRSGPAAAMNGHAQTRLERLVTELAGTHEVQHWHVDAARLDGLLEELADQPGVHAVHVNPDGRNDPGAPPQPARPGVT